MAYLPYSQQLFNIGNYMNNGTDASSIADNLKKQNPTLDFSGGVGNNSESMFSWLNADNLGLVNQGLNAVGGLMNAYQGMRGLDLAKDQFNFNKGAFLTDLANQANLTNERLATRQATRLRSAGVPEDQIQGQVADYMKKYGAKSAIGG